MDGSSNTEEHQQNKPISTRKKQLANHHSKKKFADKRKRDENKPASNFNVDVFFEKKRKNIENVKKRKAKNVVIEEEIDDDEMLQDEETLDSSLKGAHDLIEESMNRIMIEKSKIESMIDVNLIVHPHDEKLLSMKKRLEIMFPKTEKIAECCESKDVNKPEGNKKATTQKGNKDDGVKELRSEYINKKLDTIEPLTEDEKVLGESIFGLLEEEQIAEEVFLDHDGKNIFRMSLQTLAPKEQLDIQVIDAYASLLNHEEKSKMAIKRHFFYASMLYPEIQKETKDDFDEKVKRQYETFHQEISRQMKNDVEKMQMNKVDLAFFPILAHEHYYLIVFKMKTGEVVIIDNSDSEATYEGKYEEIVKFVSQIFGMHFEIYGNKVGSKILSSDKKAKILNMDWKTTAEKIDCGVYMLLHMELYDGSSLSNWSTGLLKENHPDHRKQIVEMRYRIAAKMLLHDVNYHRSKMSDYATGMNREGQGKSDE